MSERVYLVFFFRVQVFQGAILSERSYWNRWLMAKE